MGSHFQNSAENLIQKVIMLGFLVSCAGMVIMLLVLVADVCLRSVIDVAIPGTIELVELLMVFVAFFSLAYTSLEKGHVSIGLIVSHLPKKIQTALDILASLLGIVIWALICRQLAIRGLQNINAVNPMHTPRLLIPTAPFMFTAAMGCLFYCLHLLIDLINSIRSIIWRQIN